MPHGVLERGARNAGSRPGTKEGLRFVVPFPHFHRYYEDTAVFVRNSRWWIFATVVKPTQPNPAQHRCCCLSSHIHFFYYLSFSGDLRVPAGTWGFGREWVARSPYFSCANHKFRKLASLLTRDQIGEIQNLSPVGSGPREHKKSRQRWGSRAVTLR